MDEVENYIREVYRLAPQIGFDPAIIVAQSDLETGHWKSLHREQELNPAGLGITGNQWQTEPGFAKSNVPRSSNLLIDCTFSFTDTFPEGTLEVSG